MNNYVKLLNNLEELGLLNIKASIDKYIDLINSGNKSIVDFMIKNNNTKNRNTGLKYKLESI